MGFVPAEPLAARSLARCVNRRACRRSRFRRLFRAELVALGASGPGTHLAWIGPGPAMGQVAALAAQSDRILFENRALHGGLYRWLRWSPADTERTRDGMPVASLELSLLERPGFRLLCSWRWARLLSALGITRLLPLRAWQIYRRSGAIALLTVTGRRREDFVRAGDVLERIWLTAALRGLAFQPITGITLLLLRLELAGGEGLSPRHRHLVETLGRQLVDVFPVMRGAAPVMLFRLGTAPPPSARALRRASETLLSME